MARQRSSTILIAFLSNSLALNGHEIGLYWGKQQNIYLISIIFIYLLQYTSSRHRGLNPKKRKIKENNIVMGNLKKVAELHSQEQHYNISFQRF